MTPIIPYPHICPLTQHTVKTPTTKPTTTTKKSNNIAIESNQLTARAVAAIMATRAAIFSMLKRRGRDGMDKKKVCVWVWVWGQASRTTEEEIGNTR